MNILVTGCAGFIGYHFCIYLLKNKKNKLFGLDNLNNYYDIKLKKNRLSILKKYKNFNFKKVDINKKYLENFFKKIKLTMLCIWLLKQVRYSIENPRQYLESNILGFLTF